MQTLVEFMGGPDDFEKRLDYIFVPGTSEQDLADNGAGITTIMNIGFVTSTFQSTSWADDYTATSQTSAPHTSTTILGSQQRAYNSPEF